VKNASRAFALDSSVRKIHRLMIIQEARQQVKEFFNLYGLDVIVDYLLELPMDRLRSESVQLSILALQAGDLVEMREQVEVSSNSKTSHDRI
jgi:hypothetical protein